MHYHLFITVRVKKSFHYPARFGSKALFSRHLSARTHDHTLSASPPRVSYLPAVLEQPLLDRLKLRYGLRGFVVFAVWRPVLLAGHHFRTRWLACVR